MHCCCRTKNLAIWPSAPAIGWRSDPVAERRRVPADERSAVALAMQTQQLLQVEDIRASDLDLWTSDWLRAEGFQGHTVVPLVVEGRAIGAMAIDTYQPRLMDQDEVRFLRLIVDQAAIVIEKERLYQEEIKQQRLEQELAIARQIQLTFLPEVLPLVPGWEFAAYYQAARMVGGDFYDFFELPGEPGLLGMVIADVTDKGVPAALFMALSRTLIRTTALSGRSPGTALTRANQLILKDSQANMFVSAFYATLDTDGGKLAYANAGHNLPLWLQVATGELRELAARGIVLGVFYDLDLEECEISVAPGDFLVFYTDGVTEAMDANKQMFGEDGLRAAVTANSKISAQELLEVIVQAVGTFTGNTPQSDDFTLFVVKRNAL